MTAKRRRLGLPLLLGAITFSLILLALWPQETPTMPVVVAARDLGAGSVLSSTDLTTLSLPVDLAPVDASSDPAPLIGHSLAVVRFRGETISPRHLGPQVALQADERAVALQVTQDQALGGILQPGMQVGVVATLPDADGKLFAKALLENLRVLYISPEFQARPALPATAELQVRNGESTSSSVSAGGAPARQGIVILAVPVAPQPLTYVPLSETSPLTATTTSEPGAVAVWQAPQAAPDLLNASTVWVNAVELLAALNNQDHAFTLVLQPPQADAFTSPGLNLNTLVPTPAVMKEVAP